MVAQPAVKMWSRSNANVQSQDQIKKTASVTDGYTVITDPGDTQVDALDAPDLPEIGDVLPGTVLLCTGRVPQQVSPIFWIINIEYSGEFGASGADDSPVNMLPKVTWSNVTSTEAIDEAENVVIAGGAINQKSITTVLGEPIEGVTKPVSDFRLVVERNYLDINMPATADYLDSVNSDIWPPDQPFAPGTGHLEAFTADEAIDKNLPQGYYKVRAEIMFRVPYRTIAARAWWKRVLHEGYRYIRPDGVIQNATDGNQADTTKPILLAFDGGRLPNGANPVWMEFQVFQYELPYAALGLL